MTPEENWVRRIHFVGSTLHSLSERVRAHILAVEDDDELVELFIVSRDRRIFDVMHSIQAEMERRSKGSILACNIFEPYLN